MTIVTVFSCFERLLGFIYRIFLSRALGSEGVGIYQIALSVVGLLMTITASGIPVTVSRIMIKNEAELQNPHYENTVFSGIFLSATVSIPLIAVLYLFPDFFSFVFTDKRSYRALEIILPGIAITAVYAVIRGFFWGRKKFLLYSIIELSEEAVMLAAGVFLITRSDGVTSGVNRAAYAVLISYCFSFVTAVISYFIIGGKVASPMKELKPLIASSAPITLMRTATSLINTLIAIILPARLVAGGLSSTEALSGFGELSGMSIPLIFIPSTLIGSVALVLVPELSENYYRGNDLLLKRNAEQALKFSVFISCMIIPVFLSLGKELGELLYGSENAGVYVSRACYVMLPMSVTMISTSMLNSLNAEKRTLIFYLAGAAFLIFSVYFLPKYIGVYSLVAGLAVSYVITAVLNVLHLKKRCKYPPKVFGFIILSLLFTVPSALFGFLLKKLLSTVLSEIPVIAITGLSVAAFNYAFFRIFNLFDVKAFFKK